ncbi:hypothetical protein PVAP13_7KG118510 [Panicum virgatum]|uniref:Uncharacterized protein n=1 Tax=Panicum virgatum TaxID=38727 RepID=A0A8T0QGP1_PANVG|nr:hypothetical protein PVAP13_7KG118510 [Panicum virgatum]
MKEFLPIHHHHLLQHRGGLKTTPRPPWMSLHGCLLRLPRTMIPACIHLWLSYAVLPETWGHRNVIATLQITYTHNVREVGMVGVVSCLHLFLRRHCGLFRLFGL